jgi:cell wall-associated NlpC family hydrolase
MRKYATLLLLNLFLIGCAYTPVHERKTGLGGNAAADTALAMLGTPYRYGGYNPGGFDCSGLVYYSYKRAGIEVPRDTQGQRKYGAPISSRSLKKGDLLFFNLQGKRFSHVAIYLGDETFVHAPATGKNVRTDKLSDPYWRKYFVGARRF